mgnify:FL=1
MSTPVVPGTKIGTVDEYLAGEGTYVRGRDIYSALLGYTRIDTEDATLVRIRLSLHEIHVARITRNILYTMNNLA